MKPGGGNLKGHQWERDVGKALALWITNGQRPDIFSRNVLSGGSFTRAERLEIVSSRMPGDIMAAHPLAFDFLSKFAVECKHLRDIGLTPYFWDPRAKTELGIIITKAHAQAHSIGLRYMVVAKQNMKEPLLFVDGRTGDLILRARRASKRVSLLPMYHVLHKGTVFVMRFRDFVVTTDPRRLLESM